MAPTIPTLISFHRKIDVFAFFLLLVPLWSNIGVQAQLLIRVPGLPTCADACADRAAFGSGCLPISQKCLCGPPATTFGPSTLTCAERACTTPEIFTVRQALSNFCAAATPSPPVTTSDTTTLITVTSISTSESSTFIPTTSETTTETPTLTPTPSSTTTITVPPDSTTVVFETVTATSNAIASFRPSFGLEHGAWLTLLPTFLGLFFGTLAIL